MTAVEFLENQLTLALGDEVKDLQGLFVVAKEMHDKQIKDAYGHGQNNGRSYLSGDPDANLITAEQYYQQQFKK